jgi:hypothetical protein
LDRGGHGGGGTPVDDEVVLDRDGGGKNGGSEEKGQEAREGKTAHKAKDGAAAAVLSSLPVPGERLASDTGLSPTAP